MRAPYVEFYNTVHFIMKGMLAMLKRIIAASLAACMMLVSLSACGTTDDNNATSDPAQTGASSETASVASGASSTATVSGNNNSGAVSGTTGTTSNGGNGGGATSGGTGSKAPNQQTSSTTGTGGNKVLKIWWGNDDESMQAAVRMYRQSHPDVVFNIVTPPEYNVEKLKVAISAGTEPNIVSLDHVYITALGTSGQILDLNKYGASKIKSKYISSCWNAVTFGSHVYGLPHDGNTIALMYNKDMLQKANQSAPKTFNQLLSVGKKVQSYLNNHTGEGEYAFTSPFFAGDSQNRKNWSAFVYFFWLWRNGGDILNSSNTKAVFNSSAGVNALNQLKQLVSNNICAGDKYMEPQFYNGTIGMIEMGNWSIPTITSMSKNADFGVAMMPRLKSGVPQYSGLGLYALGITKKTTYKQEAFDFIKYYTTNDTFQLQYGKQHNQLPVTKTALNDSYYSSNIWKLYKKQYALSKARPGVNNWDSIEIQIADAVNNAIKGTSKSADALNNAAKKVNTYLK